jgi:hypothetical protein
MKLNYEFFIVITEVELENHFIVAEYSILISEN